MASKPTRIESKELKFSNLDKVMYPATGFTKGQVIDYYRRVAPYILPHLKDRPITRLRFPDGVRGGHFYEKNAPSFTPKWIKTFAVARASAEAATRYILVDDAPTLLWLANLATLEIHPLLARAPKIRTPTMVVFDLDPGEGVDILASAETAFLIRDLLRRLKLQSWVKVSGSKGIHLHVPLNTAVGYEATQAFAHSVARWLEREYPDRVVSEMAKAKRKGKVFVDWSQNAERKSTVAVYSLRAKHDTPYVAMPVSWPELEATIKRGDAASLFFEPAACLKRLEKLGDVFAPLLRLKQRLPEPFLTLDGGRANGARESALETYRRKRDFTRTPEPPPAIVPRAASAAARLFVVQKHAATRLHYDFRLEMDGVLKSWAVPKGPPYDAGEKRLAMPTEDHPMEYARFEGIIPAGQYGGGTVMVWDIGTYRIVDGNYGKGKLHVVLDGKKLKGEWVLVRGGARGEKKESWLLIKAGAAMARLAPAEDDASALTGRSMKQIAAARDAEWQSDRAPAGARRAIKDGQSVDLAALPEVDAGFIEPMQCLAAAKLPEGAGWLYEVKLDGYRALAVKKNRGVTLFSRSQKTLNRRFPGLAAALEALDRETVLDGEIVALDSGGRPSFTALQNARGPAAQVFFYAFDVPVYRGRSLLGAPLEKRRRLLRAVVSALGEPVRISENFSGAPADLIAAARNLGLEGLLAKKKESAYEPGRRSGAWMKFKINRGQEFVVGGYVPGAEGFQSPLAGCYDGGKLQFVAKVKDGFVPRVKREIAARFAGLATDRCPFVNLPEKKGARRGEALTAEAMKKCRWLKPELVIQVEFADWTEANRLRHAKFAGLRDDKNPQEIVREYAPSGK